MPNPFHGVEPCCEVVACFFILFQACIQAFKQAAVHAVNVSIASTEAVEVLSKSVQFEAIPIELLVIATVAFLFGAVGQLEFSREHIHAHGILFHEHHDGFCKNGISLTTLSQCQDGALHGVGGNVNVKGRLGSRHGDNGECLNVTGQNRQGDAQHGFISSTLSFDVELQGCRLRERECRRRKQGKHGKESFHGFMVLKPKDKHGFLQLVPRRSHRLGSGKGRGDDLAVLVLILLHGPLPQGFGILFRQPAKRLFQFGCEQSTIKTHSFQDGLAKFQHRAQVMFVGKMHSLRQFVSRSCRRAAVCSAVLECTAIRSGSSQ